MSRRSPSLGIKTCAILIILFHIYLLVWIGIITPLMLWRLTAWQGLRANWPQLVAGMGVALFGLVAGVGLLLIRCWSRRLTVFLAMLWIGWCVVIQYVDFRMGYKEFHMGRIVVLLFSSLMFWYLERPLIKAQFVVRSQA